MNITNNKIMVAVALGLCLLFLPLSQVLKGEPIEIISEVQTEVPIQQVEREVIYVQVQGAVSNPGLYQMNSGDRINDLLDIAGASNYNSQCINLAQKLVDEQNVYVPKKNELCLVESSIDEDGVVNINTASEFELQTIPGIGESKAKKIIEYRKSNGTFQKKEDLLEVEGISEKLLQSIGESISLA